MEGLAMSEQTDTLKDDIAFMRAMAQDGRRGPMIGGASLVSAGVVFSIATLVCWAMATGLIAAQNTWFLGVWVAAMAVHLGVMAILIGRWRRTGHSGAAGAANRAFRWAWSACGWSIGVIFAGSALTVWRTHSWMVFASFPTVILAPYGAAWSVSAAMSDRKWMRWVAIGSFAAALGMALVPDVSTAYLAFAAALILLAAAPGYVLMREQPTSAA
jgi:hypothetical protein